MTIRQATAKIRALETQLRVCAQTGAADVIRSRRIAEEWRQLFMTEKTALEHALAQMAKG